MRRFALLLPILILLANCQPVHAAATTSLRSDGWAQVQGGAPNPFYDYLITTDASTIINLTDQSGRQRVWFNLIYNGTGTCYVRKMNDQTKASWVQIPVAAGTSYDRVINKDTLYLNLSSCKGGTAPNNSVLELN